MIDLIIVTLLITSIVMTAIFIIYDRKKEKSKTRPSNPTDFILIPHDNQGNLLDHTEVDQLLSNKTEKKKRGDTLIRRRASQILRVSAYIFLVYFLFWLIKDVVWPELQKDIRTQAQTNTTTIVIMLVLGLITILYLVWNKLKSKEKKRSKAKSDNQSPKLSPSFATRFRSWIWDPVLVPVGQFLSLKLLRKLWMISVILASVYLIIWIFLPSKFLNFWSHQDLFWAVTLGVIIPFWLVLSGVIGKTGGKWVATLFALLFFVIFFRNLDNTETGKLLKQIRWSNPASATGVVAKPVLPNGKLRCDKDNKILAITGGESIVTHLVRNIDIVYGSHMNFDLWTEAYGTYAQFRWDMELVPEYGTFTRLDQPVVSGTWKLSLETADRFIGWSKRSDAEFKEKMTLVIDHE